LARQLGRACSGGSTTVFLNIRTTSRPLLKNGPEIQAEIDFCRSVAARAATELKACSEGSKDPNCVNVHADTLCEEAQVASLHMLLLTTSPVVKSKLVKSGVRTGQNKLDLNYLTPTASTSTRIPSARRPRLRASSSSLLTSLELSDTHVFEPYTRALLGTGCHVD